ncbi:hypothetical protein KEM56_007522 [Ascosphaera pollenicola]|nr:hypothetical protein KEM56_007522 [Ascosphaera pollenicola]
MGHVTFPQDEWNLNKLLGQIPERFEENSSSPVPFFHLVERLKTTKREGWRRCGVQGESISDHMYRMSIMTMLAPPSLTSKIDIARCTKIALVHDMAEALVGDITPVDLNITKEEKHAREAEVMDYIAKRLLGKVHGGVAGEDIRAAFQEYEESKTLESIFVHDVDKMELILQAIEYERANEGKVDLAEFYDVRERIQLPEVAEWADQVLKERDEFWAQRERPGKSN